MAENREFLEFVPVAPNDSYPVYRTSDVSRASRVAHELRCILIRAGFPARLERKIIEQARRVAVSTYPLRLVPVPLLGAVD